MCHISAKVPVLIILRKLREESVVSVRVALEVGVGHNLEKEAEDSIAELGAAFLTRSQVTLDAMHDVQLEVKQLTVDTVFGRGVEVRLHAVESDFAVFQVRVKQTRRLRQHVIHTRIQLINKLRAFLVKALRSVNFDRLINDGEVFLEVFEDGYFRLKIDRSLLFVKRVGRFWNKVEVLLTGPL